LPRLRIIVSGIVQGVGFRPFVYALARRHQLTGFVRNTLAGLHIEAEGAAVAPFVTELRTSAPTLARVDHIAVEEIPPGDDPDFTIRDSDPALGNITLVSPDFSTCDACLSELTQPADRRYLYPFINCTHCGPRYTIIRDLPYDRHLTTMASFAMCPECAAEYGNPSDRRFHAQPNACPRCGPQLSASIPELQGWLAAGLIVAIKGLGGYHLACDARQETAVARLRERKRRGDKPFAVMARDLDAARRIAVVDAAAEQALADARRPIVLLPRRHGAPLAAAVAPGLGSLGVMLPYTPLHTLLFHGAPYDVLVMTSGNRSEEPIVSREEELPRIAPLADRLVSHNRAIHTRVDDSVVRLWRGRMLLSRRARGWAPAPLQLGQRLPHVFACGGDLKSAFCLTRDHWAILSQHIGDLENLETLDFFREALERLERFFRVTPEVVAHDLHPSYVSVRLAASLAGVPRLAVQHHHAHVAACMAEHALDGEVIGLALDGTGYGVDGAVWGGEVMVAGYAGFQRRYHLRYVALPGGDQAVREPWRMALSYLADAGEPLPPRLAEAIPEHRRRVVAAMVKQRAVVTSSAGRLFDAVAALLVGRLSVTYEAQAAMELEAIAAPGGQPLPFAIDGEEIDFRPAIAALLRSTEPAPVLAGRFHATLAEALVECARRIRRQEGLNRVCLGGGSFQNLLLLELTVSALERAGFTVFVPQQAPASDGGLALGQALIAARRL
jgi:hydrogenase maturation protein HypF